MLPDSSRTKTTSPFGTAAVAEAAGDTVPTSAIAAAVAANSTCRHAARDRVITVKTLQPPWAFMVRCGVDRCTTEALCDEDRGLDLMRFAGSVRLLVLGFKVRGR